MRIQCLVESLIATTFDTLTRVNRTTRACALSVSQVSPLAPSPFYILHQNKTKLSSLLLFEIETIIVFSVFVLRFRVLWNTTESATSFHGRVVVVALILSAAVNFLRVFLGDEWTNLLSSLWFRLSNFQFCCRACKKCLIGTTKRLVNFFNFLFNSFVITIIRS